MCSDDMADLEKYLCLEADICPRSLPPAYIGVDSGHIYHTCESITCTLMFYVLWDSNTLLPYFQVSIIYLLLNADKPMQCVEMRILTGCLLESWLHSSFGHKLSSCEAGPTSNA